MKSALGLVVACAACCALPFAMAVLVGAGTAGAALSFWQWEIGIALLVLAAVGALALAYHRRREGATCRTDLHRRCPSSEQSGRFEAAANGGFGASGLSV